MSRHAPHVLARLAPHFLRLLFALLIVMLLTRAASQVQASGTPTFGHPVISGVQGNGFEQDVRLDPSHPGTLYTSAPASLSSNTSFIWHSEDGGKTFKWVPAEIDDLSLAALPSAYGKPTTCAGGGDSELAVDTAGHIYFNDLTVANFGTARSDDHGKTFLCSNTGVPDLGVDRQWYSTEGDPTNGGIIFLSNDEASHGTSFGCANTNQAGNNGLVMYRSPANGALGATAGIEFGPPFVITCDEGIMGNNEISPIATKTGEGGQTLATAVQHVYNIHDDAALHKILIARCFPVAFGPAIANTSDPSGLRCEDLPVANLGANQKTGGNFPTLAIDRTGNLYAVWEQAPSDSSGNITGDVVLSYAFSTNEGNTWSTPLTIPRNATAGTLNNNVFAWAQAGDDGRVDIAWYGTTGVANPSDPCGAGKSDPTQSRFGGPDATTNAIWSLYFTQTLNGHHAGGVTFTSPILAGEHFMHKGTIQTVLGGQCGDRTLGDFIQLRIGPLGEANISFADSNNVDEAFAPHAMFVRQNGGSGVYAATSPVSISGLTPMNSVTDVSGDATLDANGTIGPNQPNLDILASSMSKPNASNCAGGIACYRVTMKVSNLTSLAPSSVANTGGADLIWMTQWFMPSLNNPQGGKTFIAYFESDNGAAPQCWAGENAAQLLGGGVTLTYPGTHQITTANACRYTATAPGTITIDVPITDVSLPSGSTPLNSTLYSVTASTLSTNAPPSSVPPNSTVTSGPVGGVLFNLLDVAPPYDFKP